MYRGVCGCGLVESGVWMLESVEDQHATSHDLDKLTPFRRFSEFIDKPTEVLFRQPTDNRLSQVATLSWLQQAGSKPCHVIATYLLLLLVLC